MFTSVDKALAAIACGIVYIINEFSPFHFGVDESTVSAVVGIMSPLLVYFLPNKSG